MRFKLTVEQKKQFIIDSATMTLKELAEKYRMEQCTVSKWRHKLGLVKHFKIDLPNKTQFKKDVEMFPNTELAKKYGVSRELISDWRTKLGLSNVNACETVVWEQFDEDAKVMRLKELCNKYHIKITAAKLWKQNRGLTTGKKEKRVPTWIVNDVGCWICTSHSLTGTGYPGCKGDRLVAIRMWSDKNGVWPKGTICMHLCDDKLCINPNHIKPGTMKENQSHMAEVHRSPWGDRCGARRLNSEQAKKIFALKGRSSYEVARMYGVSAVTVRNIWSGYTWWRDVAGMENFDNKLTEDVLKNMSLQEMIVLLKSEEPFRCLKVKKYKGKIAVEEKKRIVELKAYKLSAIRIASLFGISRNRVYEIWGGK